MMVPKWLERLFGSNATDIAENRINNWQEWIQPICPETPTGHDIAYDDDFEAIKTELSKLSGADTALVVAASERLLKTSSKDLRVAVYFTYGNLREKGLVGFSEGLELICSLLKAYPQDLWPKKPMQKHSAVSWLCSEKILDMLAVTDLSNQQILEQTLSALILLQNLLSDWEEAFRPSLLPLLQKFEQVLEDSAYGQQEASLSSFSSESKVGIDTTKEETVSFSPVTAIGSAKMLLDQTRVMAAYLRQQDNGYWAAYKMIRAVRWGGLISTPPANNGQTRLKPPRVDLQSTLKRLVLEKQWLDLLERVEIAFLEGANHYWLDLQYYAWQGQKALGGLYADQADVALGELKELLTRCDGLMDMSFDDGSPFVSGNVAEWLQKQVWTDMNIQSEVLPKLSDSLSQHQIFSCEYEEESEKIALEKGLEAAIAWLDSQPQLQNGKLCCHKFFMMAKLADKWQKSDWAAHLLGHSVTIMQTASIESWDKEFAFEVYSMLYKLLFAKSKRKDLQQDVQKIQMQIELLQDRLIKIDAVRSLSLFN